MFFLLSSSSYFLWMLYFHTVPSLSVKGGKARWHLKSAFPSPLVNLFFFPYRQPPPSARCNGTHTHTHTYPLPAHWQWCPRLPLGLRAPGRPLVTSRPLNDTLAGCGVTRGPIKSQTQHQICQIHSCDELLDTTLSPPDDRLSTPVSRWSISRLSLETPLLLLALPSLDWLKHGCSHLYFFTHRQQVYLSPLWQSFVARLEVNCLAH